MTKIARAQDLRGGTVLGGGKYRLGELLGSGGMGAVYEAVQIDLDRHVALKVLHAEKRDDATYLERFRLEAKTGASLGHPHIVQVTEFDPLDDDGEPPFFVMELLKGENLRKRLERVGRLPPKRAVAIAMQVLSALDALHGARVIHRDIKPDNIFLVDTSLDEDFVKVLDFGVAKHPREESSGGAALTHEGHVLGTLAYMAPEQARGEDVDARADVYSVAACLYHMLMGDRPFKGATTAELWSRVMDGSFEPMTTIADERLAKIVALAMSRSPAARPATAKAFRDELDAWAKGLTDATPITLDAPATTPLPKVPPTVKSTLPLPRKTATVPLPSPSAPAPPITPRSHPTPPFAPPQPPQPAVLIEKKRSILPIVIAFLVVPALIGIALLVAVAVKLYDRVESGRSEEPSLPPTPTPTPPKPKRVVATIDAGPTTSATTTVAIAQPCKANCAALLVVNATSSEKVTVAADGDVVATDVHAFPQHDARVIRLSLGKHSLKVTETGTDKLVDLEDIDLPSVTAQLLYVPHRDHKTCFRIERKTGAATIKMPAQGETWLLPLRVDRVMDVSAKEEKGEAALQADPCP